MDRRATSGLMFTENTNGSICLQVVDYNVEFFGGHDFESWYDLNKENADKLFSALFKKYNGTKKEVLIAAFEETFNIPKFKKFCEDNDIQYSHGCWS